MGLEVLQGRNLHLKVKGLTEQRSGDCEVWGLNGAQSQRRELGGTRQRNPSLVFIFDFQAAESCVGRWGGDMELSLFSPGKRVQGCFLTWSLGGRAPQLPSLSLLGARALDILAKVTGEPQGAL